MTVLIIISYHHCLCIYVLCLKKIFTEVSMLASYPQLVLLKS